MFKQASLLKDRWSLHVMLFIQKCQRLSLPFPMSDCRNTNAFRLKILLQNSNYEPRYAFRMYSLSDVDGLCMFVLCHCFIDLHQLLVSYRNASIGSPLWKAWVCILPVLALKSLFSAIMDKQQNPEFTGILVFAKMSVQHSDLYLFLFPGRLSGVMDDRGKYIYISQEEMKAVADYIKRQGRVSISHLASKSNQFIDLEPKAVEFPEEISGMEEIAVS